MELASFRGLRLAALIALALAQGCSERVREGAPCLFNDDCADPLICAGNFCRAQCRTNRDCPTGWICNNAGVPAKQVCLPPSAIVLCAADEHCPPQASCTAAKQCRWRCSRDPDCAARRSSLTCESTNLCSEPLLVVELQIPSADASVVDATAPDVTIPDATAPDVTTSDVTAVDSGPRCTRDFQCDDQVYCNGAERCDPADPSADARGCAAPTGPRCMMGQRCDERLTRCQTMCEVTPDADGDGFNAAACGGPDCDDARASVHPGAPELCNGIDDDCDRMVDEEGAALCSIAFATAACMGGACSVATCSPGYGDCDGVGANGCETALAASPLNCGACGRLCPVTASAMTMACRAGTCAVGTCRPGFADCDGAGANGCELDVRANVASCGRCGNACSPRPNATAACVDGACGLACAAGRADCDGDLVNGCEVDLAGDRANCGACGARCGVASDGCVAGSCLAQPFASSGAEGAYAPAVPGDGGAGVVVLRAGVHQFTTVTIPAGVTVVTDGDGVLELRATGDVIIDGSIDLSGGDGGNAVSNASSTCGGTGGGGATGAANGPGAAGVAGTCAPGGRGGGGCPGGNGGGPPTCGRWCAFGGGAGGVAGPGGGGGGVAGGGGAGGVYVGPGAAGASVAGFGTGGANGTGGESSSMIATVYRGTAGGCGTTLFNAGGGGSIGARAAADLALADPTTFRAGSGGGGGGTPGTTCSDPSAAGGGGGGGGALRIASPTRIVVRGSVLARGGDGGNGAGGSAGGGGSGGVVHLSAPAIEVASGTIAVTGGRGGGVTCNGGRGGLGRVRLSVLPSRCRLTGTWDPPLPAGGCVVTTTATAGQVYIGTYPD
jgi:hypothetical protein